MSKYNLGIVKASILSNLNESNAVKEFVGLLLESKSLKLANTIFENIEKKYISNEDLAIKYIDENINLLKNAGCTKEVFETESKKFLPIMEGIKFISSDKKVLFEQIHIMLYESLNGKKNTNVNKLHDAFIFVLEYVKNNKPKQIIETIEVPKIPADILKQEFIVKSAVRHFNEQYINLLTEDETLVFKSLISDSVSFKQESFNTLKESTISSLNELKNNLESQDTAQVSLDEKREIENFIGQLNESIKNIQKLEYDNTTFKTNMIDMSTLKKELSN